MHRGKLTMALLLGFFLCGLANAKETGLKEAVRPRLSKAAAGLYMAGKKFGWTIMEAKFGRHDGKDVLIVTDVSVTRFQIGGVWRVTERKKRKIFSLKGDGPILAMDYTKLENGKKTVTTVRPKSGKLFITVQSDGQTRTREVPMSKATVRTRLRRSKWLQAQRRPGDTYRDVSFDPTATPSADTVTTFTFVKSGRMKVDGKMTDVVHVKADDGEATSMVILTKNDKFVRMTLGTILMQRESVDAVKSDVGMSTGKVGTIRVKKTIAHAGSVVRLTVRFSGLQKGDLPITHRQRIVREKDGVLTVELVRDYDDGSIRQPLSQTERKDALEATLRIQSDHASIRQLAMRIVGDESDPLKQAERLQEWVFRNLKKTYSVTATTSVRVLNNKAGKCTDHALLLVALCRAVGLPAREVGGLVYATGSEKPGFVAHAWAEIHNGRRWISIDPTSCQVFVDATHVRFTKGGQNLGLGIAKALKTKSIRIQRRESRFPLLRAAGATAIGQATASSQSLRLLYRSLDRNLLSAGEVLAEVKRLLPRIEFSLKCLTELEKTDLTYLDRQTVRRLIALYAAIRQQAVSIRLVCTENSDSNKRAYDSAAAKVDSMLGRESK